MIATGVEFVEGLLKQAVNEWTEWMDKDYSLYCTVLGIMPLHILSDIWLNGRTSFNGQAEGDICTLTVREKVTSLHASLEKLDPV